jgi:hypothetical protein
VFIFPEANALKALFNALKPISAVVSIQEETKS